MFENLRNAFREAVDNFNRELKGDGAADAVDGLLKGMEKETVDARSALAALREQLETARRKAEHEEREAGVCRRREAQARKIGDQGTAEVAGRFAKKHDRRRQVLADKADAIEAELRLREGEFEEMMEQLRRARTSREGLSATAGRAQARGTLNEADDLFDELERMAGRMEGGADAGASGSGGSGGEFFDDGREFDEDLKRARRDEVAEARLEELKRRMRGR